MTVTAGNKSIRPNTKMRKLLTRAPTLLALEGFSWALLYDLAISADLDGSVLVVQLLASEI